MLPLPLPFNVQHLPFIAMATLLTTACGGRGGRHADPTDPGDVAYVEAPPPDEEYYAPPPEDGYYAPPPPPPPDEGYDEPPTEEAYEHPSDEQYYHPVPQGDYPPSTVEVPLEPGATYQSQPTPEQTQLALAISRAAAYVQYYLGSGEGCELKLGAIYDLGQFLYEQSNGREPTGGWEAFGEFLTELAADYAKDQVFEMLCDPRIAAYGS